MLKSTIGAILYAVGLMIFFICIGLRREAYIGDKIALFVIMPVGIVIMGLGGWLVHSSG